MTLGAGGKYDNHAERVLIETKAEGVVLIVYGGERGHGVSVSQEWSVVARGENIVRFLPDLLRSVAANIEKDMARNESDRPS